MCFCPMHDITRSERIMAQTLLRSEVCKDILWAHRGACDAHFF